MEMSSGLGRTSRGESRLTGVAESDYVLPDSLVLA
jgi:hypothetical protein